MKKFINGMKNCIYKLYDLLDKSYFITSIRKGFLYIIPFFMIGAFALLFKNFPSTHYQEFISTFLNGAILDICTFIYNATYGFAAIYVLLSISLTYAKSFSKNRFFLNLINALTAFACYLIITWTDTLSFDYFDVKNVFASLIIAFVSTRLFFLFYKSFYKIRKSRIVSDVNFGGTIASIWPMLCNICIATIFAIIVRYGFKYNNALEMVISILNHPFKRMGRTFFSAFFKILFEGIFWIFGIHGQNVFESINQQVFFDTEGAFLCKSFLDTFVLMGGCGTSICLLIAIIIFSRRHSHDALIKGACVPMIFNINEIMIFGFPVVLNPALIIPFLLTPLICYLNSYLFVIIGFLPKTISNVTWTTPVLYSGFLATGSINGTIVQLINLVIGVLIYAPFVKLNDEIQLNRYQTRIEEMTEIVKENELQVKETNFLSTDSKYSDTALMTILRLKYDMSEDLVDVYYQPICDHYGKVLGAESLLRWKNSFDTFVYPPLIVNLCKNDHYFDELSMYIITKVVKYIHDNIDTISGTYVSVNIGVNQLLNEEFINKVIKLVTDYNIPKDTLVLEITEDSIFDAENDDNVIFEKLESMGIKVSIDDFSMGHTSISYLQSHKFENVKIDGKLVKDLNNPRVKEIIGSIIKLGGNLGFNVIAEFVENNDIKNMLFDLGCDAYQGYLYSKAIKGSQYTEFVKEHHKEKEENLEA